MANKLNMQVQIRGVAESAKFVDDIAERALDGTPAFEQIQAMLLQSEQLLWGRFKKGRLVKTGALKASLTEGEAQMVSERSLPFQRKQTVSKSNIPGAIREIYPERLRFGTSIYYAVFHQHGGTAVKGNVLVFRPADKRRAKDIIADYLVPQE